MVTKWQVEMDDYANKVLARHWPNVRRYRDVREVGKHNLEPVDVISGGFPCQDLSVAGKRAGIEAGERSGLWWEMLRVACELRPRFLVVENVPGLLSGDGGGWARVFFGSLAESGFDAEWGIVSAADAGAPHLRKRVFVVAYAKHISPRQSIEGGGFPQAVSNGDGGGGRLAHAMAYAASERTSTTEQPGQPRCVEQGGKDVADAAVSGLEGAESAGQVCRGSEGLFAERCQEWWSVEPDVGRVAHGIPARVDRLRCLGNAVAPQVAEWIGRRIVHAQGEEE